MRFSPLYPEGVREEGVCLPGQVRGRYALPLNQDTGSLAACMARLSADESMADLLDITWPLTLPFPFPSACVLHSCSIAWHPADDRAGLEWRQFQLTTTVYPEAAF